MRRYLEQGAAADRIAAETGWSAHYVRARLREHGIPVRGRGPAKPTPLDPPTLTGLLGEGLSVIQIAGRTGYSRTRIYTLMRRLQFPVPTATHPGRDGALDEEQLTEALVRLYRDEGLTLAQVGAAHGHSHGWARSRLLAAGVALRPGGQQPAKTAPDDGLTAAQLERWYADGLTVADIAARSGRPRDTVAATLRGAGVQFRRGRRPPTLDPSQLRALYVDAHLTLAQTAKQLGCSTRSVSSRLTAAGIAPRPSRRPATAPTLAPLTAPQLRDLYLTQGLGLAEIAARVGGSMTRIRGALIRHRIPRRASGTHRAVAPLDVDAATLHQLYVTERLDDPAIAARYGVPVHRVLRRRRQLGVIRPQVPPPHPPPPPPPPPDELRRLYLEEGLTLAVIAGRYRTAAPKVRRWLDEDGIPVRPRTTRATRTVFDPALLRELYTDRNWTAAEIAAELDASPHTVLRSLHANAIPVRRGGARPLRDADQPTTRLLTALYADPDIAAALSRHRVPRRPRPGPIADRFPTPATLTPALLRALYDGVGLSARQIELLTGQPHEQILDAVHAAGLPVRCNAGPSPWSARQY